MVTIKMRCAKCNKEATVSFRYGEYNYCDNHFMESIQKRVRKEIRTHYDIDVKQTYNALKEETPEYYVTEYMLTKIFKGRLKARQVNKITQEERTIVPTTLDKEIARFFHSFLKNENFELSKTIKPLRVVLEAELKEICRILKIPYSEKEPESDFIEKIEDKYPGTKFRLLKSLKFFEENSENQAQQ